MAYQDTWVNCTRCGSQFVFRVEDQRRQAERGEEITPPTLCPSCRGVAPARRESSSRREPRPRSRQKPEAKKTPAFGTGPREGAVKWYDQEKGYGFIVDSSGEELFFHRTGLAPGESPHFPEGTQVGYLVEQTDKGPQATDVERLDVEHGE